MACALEKREARAGGRQASVLEAITAFTTVTGLGVQRNIRGKREKNTEGKEYRGKRIQRKINNLIRENQIKAVRDESKHHQKGHRIGGIRLIG